MLYMYLALRASILHCLSPARLLFKSDDLHLTCYIVARALYYGKPSRYRSSYLPCPLSRKLGLERAGGPMLPLTATTYLRQPPEAPSGNDALIDIPAMIV